MVGKIPNAAGLRIITAQRPDGTTGLALALAEEPAPSDRVVEEGDARVFMEPLAAAASRTRSSTPSGRPTG
jgi:hypothetical protein